MSLEDAVGCTSKFYLRIGLVLELIGALALGIILAAGDGMSIGHMLSSLHTLSAAKANDLSTYSQSASTAQGIALPAAIASFLMLLGSLFISSFQSFLSNDPGQKVPHAYFRVGVKFLFYAAALDIVGNVVGLASWSFMAGFGENSSGMEKLHSSGGFWLIFQFFGAGCAFVSYIFYGSSFGLMHCFNDTEGKLPCGMILGILYKAAGVIGLVGLLVPWGSGGLVVRLVAWGLFLVALLCACLWSVHFEPDVKEGVRVMDAYEVRQPEPQAGASYY